MGHLLYNTLHAIPQTVFYFVALSSGIAFQMGASWIYVLFTLFLTTGILQKIYHHSLAMATLLSLALALCGAWRLATIRSDHISKLRNLPNGKITLEGIIIDQQQYDETKNYITLYTAKIIDTYKNREVPAQQAITRLLIPSSKIFQYNDNVKITNVFLSQKIPPSYELYLCKKGITVEAKITQTSEITITAGAPSLIGYIKSLRSYIVETAQQKLSSETFGLFSTLFLGFPSAHVSHKSLDKDIFSWWGLNHILARSGIHLMLLVQALNIFLGCIPLGFGLKKYLITLSIAVYSLLSWTSISFIRAIALLMWGYCCLFLRVSQHNLHIIACIAIATALVQPLYLTSLDFQLSFALTFAIALAQHARTIKQQTVDDEKVKKLD